MNKRTRIFAGNWKMNSGPTEAIEYFLSIKKELDRMGWGQKSTASLRRNVIFPPAYALSSDIQQAAKQSKIELGAQNVHWEEKGAFTGELSPTAIKSIGLSWALIGHSERREYFGETDQAAAKRFERAALCGLNVVYCIGEKLSDREKNKTEAVLSAQLGPVLEVMKKLPKRDGAIWSFAYEPVWAIGTGKTATPEQAEAAHKHIRKVAWDALGFEAAQNLPILYGGSVVPENTLTLMSLPNVDGVLVGGASLKPESFARILASL